MIFIYGFTTLLRMFFYGQKLCSSPFWLPFQIISTAGGSKSRIWLFFLRKFLSAKKWGDRASPAATMCLFHISHVLYPEAVTAHLEQLHLMFFHIPFLQIFPGKTLKKLTSVRLIWLNRINAPYAATNWGIPALFPPAPQRKQSSCPE